MVEGGGAPSFPVLFFDGEREMNIGDVNINPTLEYKPFQLMLSQKIGISPNQITIYLVDRKRNPKSPFSEERRRIPITGKVNFGLICRQKDCCFLVVLKRSKKSRNRKDRAINGAAFPNLLPDNELSPMLSDDMILLRRNQPLPFYDQVTQLELANLNNRLQNQRIQQIENYQMAMAGVNSTEDDWNRIPPPHMTVPNQVFCEDCVNEQTSGVTTSFHPCVNDPIITGFVNRLGPIRRPSNPFY